MGNELSYQIQVETHLDKWENEDDGTPEQELKRYKNIDMDQCQPNSIGGNSWDCTISQEYFWSDDFGYINENTGGYMRTDRNEFNPRIFALNDDVQGEKLEAERSSSHTSWNAVNIPVVEDVKFTIQADKILIQWVRPVIPP
jgi:hypothetical protein